MKHLRLLLLSLLTVIFAGRLAAADNTPKTLWDAAQGTLVFTFDAESYGPGSSITVGSKGYTASKAWSFDFTTAYDAATLPWVEANSDVKKVVFAPNFIDARPTRTTFWFYGFENMTTIEGLEYLNTSQVTNMMSMFYGCSSLTTLDLKTFNTDELLAINDMFYDCKSLTSVDLSSFNTEKVENMSGVFENCESLTSIDLSNFNTPSVKLLSGMFKGCAKLASVDLSSFDITKVVYSSQMFSGCEALTSIYCASGADWSGIENTEGMFTDCSSLIGKGGGNQYAWSDTGVDGTYAKVCTATQDGYFTCNNVNVLYDENKKALIFTGSSRYEVDDAVTSDGVSYDVSEIFDLTLSQDMSSMKFLGSL